MNIAFKSNQAGYRKVALLSKETTYDRRLKKLEAETEIHEK